MSNIKTIVRGAYDVQKLRIQMGNRIIGNWKAKSGQAPSRPETDLSREDQNLLATIRASYRKIMDAYGNELPPRKKFVGDEVISTYTELVLFDQYVDLEEAEESHFKMLGKVLQDYPVYNEFLTNVRGCGPAMSGVIISEIDIHKCKYASSVWAYCGLDVASDGKGRSRRKEHLVEREYTDKEGNAAQRVGITFNPFLKTKLVGVLGSSFLRSNSPYAQSYRDYKHRLEQHPAHQTKTPAHRHNMAVRYMVKRFLVDLYTNWRSLENLPVHAEYSEAKLGLKHGQQ